VRGNASLLTLQCEGPKGPGITGFPPLSGLRPIPGPCVETTPEACGRGVGASPARGAERKAQGARRTTPARLRPAPHQPSCRPAMAMNADDPEGQLQDRAWLERPFVHPANIGFQILVPDDAPVGLVPSGTLMHQ
jgi:hypothetical protein